MQPHHSFPSTATTSAPLKILVTNQTARPCEGHVWTEGGEKGREARTRPAAGVPIADPPVASGESRHAAKKRLKSKNNKKA